MQPHRTPPVAFHSSSIYKIAKKLFSIFLHNFKYISISCTIRMSHHHLLLWKVVDKNYTNLNFKTNTAQNISWASEKNLIDGDSALRRWNARKMWTQCSDIAGDWHDHIRETMSDDINGSSTLTWKAERSSRHLMNKSRAGSENLLHRFSGKPTYGAHYNFFDNYNSSCENNNFTQPFTWKARNERLNN